MKLRISRIDTDFLTMKDMKDRKFFYIFSS